MSETQAGQQSEGFRVPVLMYHSIGGDPVSPRRWNVSPERFEGHVRWLSEHGYHGISVRELGLHWLEGRPLPGKPVAITFDDSYANVHRFALPVLQRHGFRATAYVVTSCIGGSNRWDQAKGMPALATMGAEQLREWVEAGFDLGSHSASHPDLTAVSEEKLEEEVAGSAKALEAMAGFRPTSFAYPYGRFDDRVVGAVRRVYRMAVSSEAGICEATADPYRVPRLPVFRFTSERELGRMLEKGSSGMLRLRRVYLAAKALLERS